MNEMMGGRLSSVGEIPALSLKAPPAPLMRRRCHCQARHPSKSHGQGERMTGATNYLYSKSCGPHWRLLFSRTGNDFPPELLQNIRLWKKKT